MSYVLHKSEGAGGIMWLPSCPWPCITSGTNVLLIGFSEIGEDVDSLALVGLLVAFNVARHHSKDSKGLNKLWLNDQPNERKN